MARVTRLSEYDYNLLGINRIIHVGLIFFLKLHITGKIVLFIG